MRKWFLVSQMMWLRKLMRRACLPAKQGFECAFVIGKYVLETPKTSYLVFWLAPVSFVKYPTASALDPAWRYPNNIRAWWTHPTPSHPHITVTIPTLVPANPDITRCGCDSNHPNSNRRRWRNPNQSLCNSDRPCQQHHSQKNGWGEILFHNFLLPLIVRDQSLGGGYIRG